MSRGSRLLLLLLLAKCMRRRVLRREIRVRVKSKLLISFCPLMPLLSLSLFRSLAPRRQAVQVQEGSLCCIAAAAAAASSDARQPSDALHPQHSSLSPSLASRCIPLPPASCFHCRPWLSCRLGGIYQQEFGPLFHSDHLA